MVSNLRKKKLTTEEEEVMPSTLSEVERLAFSPQSVVVVDSTVSTRRRAGTFEREVPQELAFHHREYCRRTGRSKCQPYDSYTKTIDTEGLP